MHRLQTLLAIACSAAALTACGSDSEPSEPSGSSPASSNAASNDQDAARVRLRQCLSENGVEVPDTAGGQGGGPPEGVDTEKLREALEGPCKELQTGAFGDLSETDRQEFQDSFAKFAQCMRDEGVEVPDVAGGEGPPASGGGFDADDPDVQAAMRKCQDELPQNAPGGGGQ